MSNIENLTTGFDSLQYTCTECEQAEAHFHVSAWSVGEPDNELGYVEKIGQYLPFDIETPKDMLKFLGTSETQYKKGLISLSQGFGIGALAYMRRVVEDKARDILLLLAATREAEGAPATDVEEMRKLAEGRQVEPILKRAAEVLPEHLNREAGRTQSS